MSITLYHIRLKHQLLIFKLQVKILLGFLQFLLYFKYFKVHFMVKYCTIWKFYRGLLSSRYDVLLPTLIYQSVPHPHTTFNENLKKKIFCHAFAHYLIKCWRNLKLVFPPLIKCVQVLAILNSVSLHGKKFSQTCAERFYLFW